MDMKYIIMKSSRSFDNPSAIWAYRGSTCIDAGVEPGKIYDDFESAQKDADKLTKYNPVGFVVLVCKE